jgi:hypothetical protein
MEKNIIINELLKYNLKKDDIKYIFKTGSFAFIDDYNDYDFLVIMNQDEVEKKRIEFSYENKNVHIFIETHHDLLDTISYKKNTRLSTFILLFIKHELTLIEGVWDENFNFLETQSEYLEYIAKNLDTAFYKKYSFVFYKENGEAYTVPKTFFWIYIPILMIKNNSIQITKEMIEIIQDSRDMNLSADLKEEVREVLGLEDDTVPFDQLHDAKEEEKITLNYELTMISQWFIENDWKPNKIITGEWTTNDPRWIQYLSEREVKRARQDEISALIEV